MRSQIFIDVSTLQEAEDLLARAESNKRQASTAMNERSSRAHTLTFLSLEQERGSVKRSSLLCLADLGGSEQIKKSKVRLQGKAQLPIQDGS